MKKLILTMITLLYFSGCIQYSDGFRQGTLIKFSKKGLLNKTWEGQMNLGGMVSNGEGGMVPNVWNFTVEDVSLVAQIEEAFNNNKPVKLFYNQEAITAPWRSNSSYFIYRVE